MSAEAVTISYLREYTLEIASAIGQLYVELGEKHTGEPVPEEALRDIIENPKAEQIVAMTSNTLVGTAVVHAMNTGTTRRIYLDNFVTAQQVRGLGVGSAIWRAIDGFGAEHNARNLDFTSGWDREDAHKFYKRKGAKIREDTAHFHYKFPQSNT